MKVSDAIKKRKSIRKYKADPVPRKSLQKILEAARLAPSAHNSQQWKFVVVKDRKIKESLAKKANNQRFISEAPLIIAAVALDTEEELPCNVPSYALDLAIALDHMVLQATEEGLGCCWIGAFDQTRVKDILKVPSGCKVVALLPVGFAAELGREKSRKSLEEIVCYERFEE